ncbi:MAG: hypothetical protein J4F98_13570 [Acidobacteria bacterium]|nr:hypothetical protein [Acidobacteriota bacterium]
MPSPNPVRVGAILLPFLGRLRFPQLFVLLAVIFLVDLFVPDFLPLVDEAVLGLLTLMTGLWRDRRTPPDKPPEKNVTPPEARE